MAKQAFDARVQAIEALRRAPKSQDTIDQLAKALKDKQNYIVGKAAAVVGDLAMDSMIPDLLTAFERFMINPAETDPKCWAKNAIAKALAGFSHNDPAVFLKGIVHRQLEPVYGGREDSAVTLRATCTLALAHTTLPRTEILAHLVERVADESTPVRVDAIRALGQFPEPEGVLLIRLKALAGDPEPEVIGQCLSELLDYAPAEFLPFIERFLNHGSEDLQFEAVSALGASRHAVAMEHLIEVARTKPIPLASLAVETLARSRMAADLRNRLEEAITGRESTTLAGVFRKAFPADG